MKQITNEIREHISFEIEPTTRKHGQWLPLLNKSGVYLICKDEGILYIGRSKNLYTRLINHFSDGGILNALDYDSIKVIFTDNHKQTERYLIDNYNPPANGGITSKIWKR